MGMVSPPPSCSLTKIFPSSAPTAGRAKSRPAVNRTSPLPFMRNAVRPFYRRDLSGAFRLRRAQRPLRRPCRVAERLRRRLCRAHVELLA
eukprot:2197754-Pleurochrysis_carterae.AAC.1